MQIPGPTFDYSEEPLALNNYRRGNSEAWSHLEERLRHWLKKNTALQCLFKATVECKIQRNETQMLLDLGVATRNCKKDPSSSERRVQHPKRILVDKPL